MGYESKFYFVQKSSCIRRDTHYWAEIIATVDMCKIGGMPDCFMKPTNSYIVEFNDKDILKDCYGEPLYECTVPELLEWLQKEQITDHNKYCRWDILRGLAEGFAQPIGEKIYKTKEFNAIIKQYELDPRWRNVVVLHYGH